MYQDFTGFPAINGLFPNSNMGNYNLNIVQMVDKIETPCPIFKAEFGDCENPQFEELKPGITGYSQLYSNIGTPNVPYTNTSSDTALIFLPVLHPNGGSVISNNSADRYLYVRTEAFVCEGESCEMGNYIRVRARLGNSCEEINLEDYASTIVKYCGPPTISQQSALSKSVLNQTYINLAPGCSGRYVINFTNTGNTPITTLTINDVFPLSLLNITDVTINAPSGLTVPIPSNPLINTNYNLVSGELLSGQGITIYIDFEIPASAVIGSTITNCVNAVFDGTLTTTCFIDYCGNKYEIDLDTTSPSSCITFNVATPSPLIGLRKCITGPSIINIGDTQSFSIYVSNNGSADYVNVLTDLLAASQLSNISNIQYFSGIETGQTVQNFGCDHLNTVNLDSGFMPNFNAVFNGTDAWNINIPGNCNYGQMNVLKITFDAIQLPALTGINTATTGNLSNTVYYNIHKFGAIISNKAVNSSVGGSDWATTQTINAGGEFEFKIEFTNVGSTVLSNFSVLDNLPSCVQYVSHQAMDQNGNPMTSSLGVNQFAFVGLQLQPGQTATLIIRVIKIAGSGTCVNCATVRANSTISQDFLVNPTNCVEILETPPPTNEGAYCCVGGNLIENGNFENNNTGFSSQYTYQSSVATNSVLSGQYTVVSSSDAVTINPQWQVQDHTFCINGTNSQIIVINGRTQQPTNASSVIYTNTITIEEGKDYKLCLNAKNLPQCAFDVLPKIRIQILGSTAYNGGYDYTNNSNWITLNNNSSDLCDWTNLNMSFTGSGSITINVVLLEDGNGDGNDLAIDDISLQEKADSDTFMTVQNQGGSNISASINTILTSDDVIVENETCAFEEKYYWFVYEVDGPVFPTQPLQNILGSTFAWSSNITGWNSQPLGGLISPPWALTTTFPGYLFENNKLYAIGMYIPSCHDSCYSEKWMYQLTFNFRNQGNPVLTDEMKEAIKERFVLGNGLTTKNVESLDAVKIYPNPSSDIFNIDFPKSFTGQVQVSDMLGKVIFTKEVKDKSNDDIDLTNQEKGVYIAKFQNGNIRFSEKLIKN